MAEVASIVSTRRLVRPPPALITAWITLFLVGTDLFVVSPLLPIIAGDYRVSSAAVGLSVTGFALSYMLSAPFLGHLADKVGRRTVLTHCLLGFAVANLMAASAGSLPALVLARTLAGIMAAGVTPSVYALVGEAAPAGRRGAWLAISVSGLLTSLSLGTPIGTLAGSWFGWPSVFIGFGVLSLALLWLNHRTWPDAHPTSARPEPALQNARDAAPKLALTVLWSTALYGMYTYLGTGLAASGFSAERIAAVVLLYGLGAVAGNLAGGYLADRIGSRTVIGWSLIGSALGFLSLQYALHTGEFVELAFCLASAAAQLFFPAQQATLASEFPTRRATVLAWNNAALFLGISLGSLIGGEAVNLGGFATALALSAGIALAGWFIHALASGTARPVAAVENGTMP